MEATAALTDYARRVELYRTTYESLSEEDESQLSWMRLTDGGRSTCANRLHGYLPGKIMQFLSSLHTMPRNLYMTRHGQSEYNVLRKVGGDAGLSPLGEEYAVILAKFVRDVVVEEDSHARLWTSSLRRTRDTARHIEHDQHEDGWVTMRPKQVRSWAQSTPRHSRASGLSLHAARAYTALYLTLAHCDAHSHILFFFFLFSFFRRSISHTL